MTIAELTKQLRACKDVEAGPALDVDMVRARELPSQHVELLRWANGLTGYGGYFRILPIAPNERAEWLPTIDEWNDTETWKFAWPESVAEYCCFGETAWGDQYAYKRSELSRGRSAVYFLDAVAMQAEPVARSFEEFMQKEFLRNCRAPYDEMTVRARQRLGNVLASEHVIHVPSVLLTDSEDIDSVSKMPATAAMIINGDMASQLLDQLESREVSSVESYLDAKGRTRLKVVWSV
jgi:hypothetical protein